MTWYVFDLFGVLITEGHLVRDVLYNMLPEKIPYDEVKKYYRLYAEGNISTEEFWKGVRAPSAIEQEFISRFHLDPEVKRVLHRLKEQHTPALLSDIPRQWFDALDARFKIAEQMEHVVISGDVHALKQEGTAIFHHFLQQTGAAAEECIFIDDKKRNLAIAKTLGFQTCWLKREEDDYDVEPDKTITHLHEL
jgi:putative hydrolase of the HAD superfamily